MNILIRFKEKIKDLFIKENIFYFLLASIIFFIDRLSKLKIVNSFSESSYYINDYINIDLIWNIGIGFGAEVNKTSNVQSISSNVDDLEPEDLVKYGLIPEFVGRLPVISNLHELDENALVRILKEPKNALVNQYKHLFEIDNVDLTFRDEALIEIARQAIKRKTGARGLRSIMEDILMETMFGLPNEDLEKVIIDENTVISKSEPIKLLKTTPKKSSAN